MATRSEIRAQARALINETDSNTSTFLDTDLNNFIDQAYRYLAIYAEYPRRESQYSVFEDGAQYNLVDGTVKILAAYFGNRSSQNDITTLRIVSEYELKTIDPGWKDRTVQSQGRPQYLMRNTHATVVLHPRPDANNDYAGNLKLLITSEVYIPSALSSDSDSPLLPPSYHDLLAFFVAHLCYTRLGDATKSALMLNLFDKKVRELKPVVDAEATETLHFRFPVEFD